MNFWGVVLLLCILGAVIVAVGAPRSPAGEHLFAAVAPGALVGAELGRLFIIGPVVGGLPILPTTILAIALAMFMRLVSRVWADAFYGAPHTPAR